MAVTLKLLNAGAVTVSPAAIYTVPAGATGGAIVSNIRLVNTTGGALTVNVFFNPVTGSTVRLIEVSKSIAAGDLLVIKPELTLATSDAIEASASATGIDFVVCGIERS